MSGGQSNDDENRVVLLAAAVRAAGGEALALAYGVQVSRFQSSACSIAQQMCIGAPIRLMPGPTLLGHLMDRVLLVLTDVFDQVGIGKHIEINFERPGSRVHLGIVDSALHL